MSMSISISTSTSISTGIRIINTVITNIKIGMTTMITNPSGKNSIDAYKTQLFCLLFFQTARTETLAFLQGLGL